MCSLRALRLCVKNDFPSSILHRHGRADRAPKPDIGLEPISLPYAKDHGLGCANGSGRCDSGGQLLATSKDRDAVPADSFATAVARVAAHAGV